jgi:hypothetical protein
MSLVELLTEVFTFFFTVVMLMAAHFLPTARTRRRMRSES